MNKPRIPTVSRALLISLLVLGVLAFAGASGAGPLGLIVASDDPVVVVDDECTEEGDETVGEDPDGDADEDPEGEDPEGEDPEECEPGEGEDEEAPDGTVLDPESREAECSNAAGLLDEEGNAQTVDDVYGELDAPHGQTHSMEVLLANCKKNPQAPGLLRALEVHQRNLERWEARAERRADREAAKAERKAARDVAKAERKAAKGAAKAARGHDGGPPPGAGPGH
jgi:hypothetical protein